jgi:hypothetical protein
VSDVQKFSFKQLLLLLMHMSGCKVRHFIHLNAAKPSLFIHNIIHHLHIDHPLSLSFNSSQQIPVVLSTCVDYQQLPSNDDWGII